MISDQSLPLHVNVLLARVQIALLILKLLLKVRLERAVEVLNEDLLVEGKCVLNLRNIFEVDRVRDAETLHLVGVTPILEVLFEGTSAPVARSATDLTLELFAEAVKFKEPVWDWLSIPAHRQVLRIVLDTVLILIRVLYRHLISQ